MKFRNTRTGHIMYVSNKDCISMMQSSAVYEEVIDTPVAPAPEVVEAPVAEEAPVVVEEPTVKETPKPKKSKAKK